MMPSRRRLLQMLGAVSALGAGWWALLSGNRANAYYEGRWSDTEALLPTIGIGPADMADRYVNALAWSARY